MSKQHSGNSNLGSRDGSVTSSPDPWIRIPQSKEFKNAMKPVVEDIMDITAIHAQNFPSGVYGWLLCLLGLGYPLVHQLMGSLHVLRGFHDHIVSGKTINNPFDFVLDRATPPPFHRLRQEIRDWKGGPVNYINGFLDSPKSDRGAIAYLSFIIGVSKVVAKRTQQYDAKTSIGGSSAISDEEAASLGLTKIAAVLACFPSGWRLKSFTHKIPPDLRQFAARLGTDTDEAAKIALVCLFEMGWIRGFKADVTSHFHPTLRTYSFPVWNHSAGGEHLCAQRSSSIPSTARGVRDNLESYRTFTNRTLQIFSPAPGRLMVVQLDGRWQQGRGSVIAYISAEVVSKFPGFTDQMASMPIARVLVPVTTHYGIPKEKLDKNSFAFFFALRGDEEEPKDVMAMTDVLTTRYGSSSISPNDVNPDFLLLTEHAFIFEHETGLIVRGPSRKRFHPMTHRGNQDGPRRDNIKALLEHIPPSANPARIIADMNSPDIIRMRYHRDIPGFYYFFGFRLGKLRFCWLINNGVYEMVDMLRQAHRLTKGYEHWEALQTGTFKVALDDDGPLEMGSADENMETTL